MAKFIGVKMIEAVPMTAREANDKGYRIGNHSFEEDGYEVTYPDGYKSSKTSKSSISCFSTNFYIFNTFNKSFNIIFFKNISSRVFKFIISFFKFFSRTPRFISIWI